MDKTLIAQRFAKARHTYTQEACVQQDIARTMLQALLAYMPAGHLRKVIEIGCGTGSYSRLLLTALHPEGLLLNDLCPEMEECVADLLSPPAIRFLAGDAESMDFSAEVPQLITSCSTLQWFNHPETFFARCCQALPPQGILAFSTFGPENLYEIRQLTGQGLSYSSASSLKQKLETAGFHIQHQKEKLIRILFPSPQDVLHHLKQTGVTGTQKQTWTRSRLQAFCDSYIQHFAQTDGQVSLTFHPVFFIATKI